MTKIELVEKIHNELDFPKKDSSDLLESVLSIMKQTLGSGETLKVSGFGNFVVKQKKNRKGRNPQTGETITIGERRVLTFKSSKVLNARINVQNP
jgi:integration host factor subunit alpha